MFHFGSVNSMQDVWLEEQNRTLYICMLILFMV